MPIQKKRFLGYAGTAAAAGGLALARGLGYGLGSLPFRRNKGRPARKAAGTARRAVMQIRELRHHVQTYNRLGGTNPFGSDWSLPYIFELSDTAQGVASYQRTGLSQQGIDLRLYGSWRADVASGGAHQLGRIIVFQWDDDTAPTPGGILDTDVDGGAGTVRWNSAPLPYHNRAGHAKILMDEFYNLDSFSSGNGGEPIKKIISLGKNGVRADFTGSASTTGRNGRIFIMSATELGATTMQTLYLQITYRFKDLA